MRYMLAVSYWKGRCVCPRSGSWAGDPVAVSWLRSLWVRCGGGVIGARQQVFVIISRRRLGQCVVVAEGERAGVQIAREKVKS
jgi:hypothetical protein